MTTHSGLQLGWVFPHRLPQTHVSYIYTLGPQPLRDSGALLPEGTGLESQATRGDQQSFHLSLPFTFHWCPPPPTHTPALCPLIPTVSSHLCSHPPTPPNLRSLLSSPQGCASWGSTLSSEASLDDPKWTLHAHTPSSSLLLGSDWSLNRCIDYTLLLWTGPSLGRSGLTQSS